MKTNIQRTTVYLDSDLHRALRIKAAETDNSISDILKVIKVMLKL